MADIPLVIQVIPDPTYVGKPEILPESTDVLQEKLLPTTKKESQLQKSLYLNVIANDLNAVKQLLNNTNPKADVNFEYATGHLLALPTISGEMRRLLENNGAKTSPSAESKPSFKL